MIENTQHYTEGSLAKLLDDFVAVAEVLVVAHDVFLLVTVEAVVSTLVDFAVGSSTGKRCVALILYSFLDIEVVNSVELKNLSLLVLPQVRCQNATCFLSRHWEFDLALTVLSHLGRCLSSL